ncbi:deacetylase [Bradyrhizobium sp. Ec3.3]|uniref:deacetylase n=1 Tax=Bradyrhizobium sp. Ec3.3 TaxID=189753 RepID=UPI000554B2CB|nr:deacetylase [Bradyrhizobium sp. Ec3.3]
MRSFLITIDTEGDDIWSKRSSIETRNASFLPRFQALCEKFGLKPTYLVNYEMANDRGFVEFGRDLIARGAGEIGMHLHAWNSPPVHPLTSNDAWHQPFLIEYPEDEIRKKIEFHTHFLEDVFGVKMLSHRSGRWALNAFYADMLREFGFRVDCSVTPHVDWRSAGGTDYRGFPEQHYWMSKRNIALPGASSLLQVPMTIINRSPALMIRATRACENISDLPDRVRRYIWPLDWLRPNGSNLTSMLRILDTAISQNRPYVEFMTHSSELMPGGSPYFPSIDSIEKLYRDLNELFSQVAKHFCGRTLTEFYNKMLPLSCSD